MPTCYFYLSEALKLKVYDNNRHTLADLNNFITIGMSEYRVVKLSDIKHVEGIRFFIFCSIFRFAGNKICNFKGLKPQLEKYNINISKFKIYKGWKINSYRCTVSEILHCNPHINFNGTWRIGMTRCNIKRKKKEKLYCNKIHLGTKFRTILS